MKQFRIQWAIERLDDYLYAEGYEFDKGGTLTFYGCPGTTYYIQYSAEHWKNVQEINE